MSIAEQYSEKMESSDPRPVIRGSNSQALGLGWLRGSFASNGVVAAVVDLLGEFFGEWSPAERGAFGRDVCLVFAGGAKLAHDVGRVSRPCLDICGSALEALTLDRVFELCYRLMLADFRPSRLDCSFDDFSKRIKPEEVFFDYVDKGNVAHFRRETCGLHVGPVGRVVLERGTTATFGRRGDVGSGAYGRYYRKDVESDGKIDAYRWEIEFADEKAQGAWRALLAARDSAQFVRTIGELVGGAFDFPLRETGDKNLSRCLRAGWWEEVLRDVQGAMFIRVQRKKSSVERTSAWVRDQVAGSLKLLKKVYDSYAPVAGPSGFHAVVHSWIERATISAAHQRAFKEFQHQLEFA